MGRDTQSTDEYEYSTFQVMVGEEECRPSLRPELDSLSRSTRFSMPRVTCATTNSQNQEMSRDRD